MAFVEFQKPEDNSGIAKINNAQDSFRQTFTDPDSSANKLKNSAISGVNNVKAALADNEQDAENLRKLQEAALSSLQALWEEKLKRIREAWENKTPVTVKSIIDEAAPYATSIFSEGEGVGILKALYFKIDDLTCYLLGVDQQVGDGSTITSDEDNPSWMQWLSPINAVAQNIGLETIDNLSENPNVVGALSQLSGIRAIATGVEGICSCIEALKQILKYLEPLKPIADVLIDFILSWKTMGASATRAVNTLTERAQFLCQKLLVEAMGIFREFIFNIKFNVPTILVESLRVLDVSDTFDLATPPDINWGDVFGFKGNEKDKELFNNFMGAFLEGKELQAPDWDDADQYSPAFGDNLREQFPEIANYIDSLAEHTERPETLTGRLTLQVSNKLLGAAIDQARREAKIPNMSGRKTLGAAAYKEYDTYTQKDNNSSPLDKSLDRNQIPTTYFTESTIRKVSKKIVD